MHLASRGLRETNGRTSRVADAAERAAAWARARGVIVRAVLAAVVVTGAVLLLPAAR